LLHLVGSLHRLTGDARSHNYQFGGVVWQLVTGVAVQIVPKYR